MSLPKLNGGGEKLPDSVWLHHKEILHRLYIVENKPLTAVKHIMEDEHGFQPQRLCDYEVALREVLHFRKNLKREEWLTIGIHIAERKRQAKESEVIWNNIPIAAKKLRKELLRNRRPNSGSTRKMNPELPQGLVIRTPPRSPAACAVALLPSLEPQSANAFAISPQAITGGINESYSSSYANDQRIEEVEQAVSEAGEFGVSRYRKLRGSLPFNRYMARMLDYAQSHQLRLYITTEETWTSVSPRLFGANPSWQLFGEHIYELSNNGYYYHFSRRHRRFLEWLSISADFALLRSFFSSNSPTAGAVYEALLTIAKLHRMADLARVLFALRSVLRPHNSTSVDDTKFVHIAVQIGSESVDALEIVKSCLKSPLSIANGNGSMDFLTYPVLEAAANADIAMLRALVDAGWKVKPQSHWHETDIARELIGQIMSRFHNWDLRKERDLTTYITLLLRGGVLDGAASSHCELSDNERFNAITDAPIIPITWDELVIVCPPTMRQNLQMALTGLEAGQGAGINRAGVFTAAQGGAPGLHAYLEVYRDDDSFLTRVTLEECLLFSAVVNDYETASSLLEIGVDPHVGLLSRTLGQSQRGSLLWSPPIVAAAAGNLEVLLLLLSRIERSSFIETAPIHELVHRQTPWGTAKDDTLGRELCQLANLMRSKLVAGCIVEEIWDVHQSFGRNFETLEHIRNVAHFHGYGQKIDLDIIEAAVHRPHIPWKLERHFPCDVLLMQGLVDANLEYKQNGMDLLHLSIWNCCSFTVVRFLSDKGLGVHSKPCGKNHNSMLHDALLSTSPDRSEIVEFLIKEGADCKCSGDGLTILEASLWKSHYDLNHAEYRRVFERLLDLGASCYQRPRKRLSKWRPLVKLLLNTDASDDLILRAVDAGAPLDACGYGHRYYGSNLTPLQATVWHKRERLAKELIRRGADVHAPASPWYGLTALQTACYLDLPISFLEYLVVVQRVKINEPPARIMGFTSLFAAVLHGSLNIVEFLLDRGADINAMCKTGSFFGNERIQIYRPLDAAVFAASLDKVEFLLKASGRSSRGGLSGAIEGAAALGHYAILSVLRGWNEIHGCRIVEEEALWQRQNPEQHLKAPELSGLAEGPAYYDGDSEEYYDNEGNFEIEGD